MHRLTAWGSGQWTSCNTRPHCLGAVGSGPSAIDCPAASGQRAVDLLQYTASLPGGSGQWTSFNALPHCLGAVGSGPSAIYCPTAWGQWAVKLLQYTAAPPGGCGQWTFFNAPPHCLGHWAVVWCGVVWCGVVWCGVVCRRRCYQKAKGRDVYPGVKVNGLGCVCCVRAVRKCVVA